MNTLAMSQTLMNAGLERKPAEAIATIIDEKNQEIATKQDIKELRWVMVAGFTIVFAIISAGFGYLLSSINNNHELLNTLVSNSFK
jgi:cytochrome c biogenesis protein CcdA